LSDEFRSANGRSSGGPSIIVENAQIGQSDCIGPYTATGHRCQITMFEEDHLIIMDYTVIDVDGKLVSCMIGKGTKILNSNGLLLRGERVVVGENVTTHL